MMYKMVNDLVDIPLCMTTSNVPKGDNNKKFMYIGHGAMAFYDNLLKSIIG